jgi:hypothetical protein
MGNMSLFSSWSKMRVILAASSSSLSGSTVGGERGLRSSSSCDYRRAASVVAPRRQTPGIRADNIGYHFEKIVQEALEVCPHVVFPRVAHGKDLVHVSAQQSVDGSFVLAEPLHLQACKRVSYSHLLPQGELGLTSFEMALQASCHMW